MFGINSSKSKWEKVASESHDGYFRDGIRTLIIPFKVSPKKFAINADCMEIGNTYSYNYCSGCTLSMQEWCLMPQWNRPMGFPDWFLIAFPDVALWLQHQDGRNFANSNFGDIPDSEIMDKNVGRFKISFLKQLIEAYLKRKKLPLETAG